MRISRREFLKYCTIAAGALGLTTTDLLKIEDTFAKIGDGGPYVVWLPGQACTGCTMSLTNSIYYTDVGSLLLNDIDLVYNEQLCAASGDKAVAAAISAIGKTMVLAIEGAIPYGTGREEEFCTIWTRTGGVKAAGSIIQGYTEPNGTLVGASAITLAANDVLKAGSELVQGTNLPINTKVANAADRAAMTDQCGATFNTGASGGGGSNVLNTKVKIAAAGLTIPAGQSIQLLGGTENNASYARAGSTLAVNSVIRANSIVSNSFDRAAFEALSPTILTANPTEPWGPYDAGGGTTEPWVLKVDVTITGSTFQVTGPLTLISTGANLSFIAQNSVLNPGTVVTDSGNQATINLLAPTSVLNKFGYMVSDSASYLAAGINFAAGDEVILQGDVTLPATIVGSATLGRTDAADKSILHECQLFGAAAAAILCVGTCSSFGGIPAATGNKTGASGALYKGYVKAGKFNGALNEFAAKTINIPGCPPHSDWIVGTIAYLLARNLQAFPPLEAYSRPMDYYGVYQCNAGPCEWRYNQGYTAADEAMYFNPKPAINYTGPGGTPPGGNNTIPISNTYCTKSSSKLYKYKWATSTTTGKRAVGCLGVMGCKGRKTKADCSLRRWNADANNQYGSGWCVASGAGCHGCTEPTFPDKVGKFFNFA